jgi:hypothetical protein
LFVSPFYYGVPKRNKRSTEGSEDDIGRRNGTGNDDSNQMGRAALVEEWTYVENNITNLFQEHNFTHSNTTSLLEELNSTINNITTLLGEQSLTISTNKKSTNNSGIPLSKSKIGKTSNKTRKPVKILSRQNGGIDQELYDYSYDYNDDIYNAEQNGGQNGGEESAEAGDVDADYGQLQGNRQQLAVDPAQLLGN